jgi:hypothetical protein
MGEVKTIGWTHRRSPFTGILGAALSCARVGTLKRYHR